MTNAILKRLAAKGFISMRKVNARNIHYLVTADGIDLIARRSYRYLRRTVGHVLRYKVRMLAILQTAALAPPEGRGVTGVLLVGESDLDFVVEWCAEKSGLTFRHQIDATSPRSRGPSAAIPTPERREAQQPLFGEYVIASEQIPRKVAGGKGKPAWDLHLADLVVQGE